MATPVVMLGIVKSMGVTIAQKLRPEYETIRFCTSVGQAKSDIRALQLGKGQTLSPDGVSAAGDSSQAPEAVIFGRGFGADTVEEIRRACGGPSSGLVWLRASDEGVASVGRDPWLGSVDTYADRSVRVIKDALNQVKAEGKWGRDGVYTWGNPE